jgi:hypothetical protein
MIQHIQTQKTLHLQQYTNASFKNTMQITQTKWKEIKNTMFYVNAIVYIKCFFIPFLVA